MNGKQLAGAAIIGMALFVATTTAAQATTTTASNTKAAAACGWIGGQGAQYNHCDPSTTVMLDVEDIWGNIGRVCVSPGITRLQPYFEWAVTGAWFNGGVHCFPGKH
ncbi:DUF6355 family natural product biosynthesis protein [Nonomuraea jiangxiensis]|uniref:Peptidase inhibitor family I36 n=1 Tax=Nonomuraea jiangxiensis TaxID=633440 RepID=A0A1G9RNG5_9ACTN|nr:DUF6355 family natural product biosynthesis protein [Nonomuraea jiangxiensis]SDM24818.1 hypothetical protein SAMN05421869_1395 [Nonomuraea jiangxiensis]